MLAPWKKSYDKPRKHIKIIDITLSTKVHIVNAMLFPVVMYGHESCTIKRVEHPRTDAFELWCWRRFLGVSWTARRSSQSSKVNHYWVFIGRTDAEAEAPILWPADAKSQLFGKNSEAGKDWRQEERGRQRMRYLDDVTNSMDVSLSRLHPMVEDREAWSAAVHGVTKNQTWLSDWTSRHVLLLFGGRPDEFLFYIFLFYRKFLYFSIS